MITPAYSITATERVLPRLALDFTTGVLDPRVTLTRALNTATRINSNGFIEVVNADLPRFDYNPNTLAPQGLLIEESRINLASYSEDFRNTADAGAARPNTYINVTVTQNATTSPYGEANASDKLLETSATGTHFCYRSGVITAAGTYAYTIRVKPSERFKVQLQFGSTGNTAKFTLQGAGTVDYTLSSTAFIRQAADGWYYCTMVASPGSGTSVSFFILDDAGSTSYTGDPTKGVYVDCLQVEAGAFPTSYIPTTTTAVTRNADVATMTGTNFSDWYNPTEGTIVIEYQGAAVAASTRAFAITDGTLSNFIQLVASNGSGSISNYGEIVTGGVLQTALGAGAYSATAQTSVLAYKNNDVAFAKNGAATLTDNSAAIPTVNRLQLGMLATFAHLNGVIKRFYFYPQRLTNSEIQAFSK
jgi:hypothetical protein